MLLPFLLLAGLSYVLFAGAITAREVQEIGSRKDGPHPVAKFVFAGGTPLIVAAVMTWLFLIEGGATTVQLNVHSPSRMNVWSTWVKVWPGFLCLTAASVLGNLIWIFVCARRPATRPSLTVAIASFFLAVLAFFTVATHFPSA